MLHQLIAQLAAAAVAHHDGRIADQRQAGSDQFEKSGAEFGFVLLKQRSFHDAARLIFAGNRQGSPHQFHSIEVTPEIAWVS